MSLKLSRISHRGQVKTIALYGGISVDELSLLLQTVFGVSSPILGFLAESEVTL